MIRTKLLAGAILAVSLPFSVSALADFDYSDSHKFSIPQHLYDTPINQITLPGSHNSFNRSGTNPSSCVNNNPALGSNKNVHRSIHDQIVDMGLRFLEIDVYREGSNWCVYHGGDGQPLLDGNSYYFGDILKEITGSLNRIGDEIIFIKMDGFASWEAPEEFAARQEFLFQRLETLGFGDMVYKREDHETRPPTINELADAGKRLIFVSGTKGHSWGWKSAGTSASNTSRNGALADRIDNPNGADFIRWNAFGLDDTFTWGSTGDADFIHARLIGHGIEKWAQGAHRISHLNVDFPSRQSVGMSAMRAANIFNQIPSAYGTIIDQDGNPLKDIGYTYWVENANLDDSENWFDWSGYHGKSIVAEHAYGEFNFPRPHGQAISIRPFKEGYRFEPEAIYIPAEETAKPIEVNFTAIPSRSLQDIAESTSFVYKKGVVNLAAGLDLNSDGEPIVNDVTRQPGFALVNKGSGLCVGVPKGVITNGTKVTMQNCDATVEQRWSYNPDNGYIKSMKDNYCIDTQGNASSGHRMQVYTCLSNPHPNLSFNLVGQHLVPSYQDANALDSSGTKAGSPLIIWNRRNSDSNNRKWIFEKHYAVSSTGDNRVTDAGSDNKKQFFAIVNNSHHCLTADGGWRTAYVKAKNCRVNSINGDSSNMLWFEENGQLKLKQNQSACLDNKGQLWQDTEPHIWDCIAGHSNMRWGINMPYWGGAARTREALSIFPINNNSVVLDHPRDNLVRLANWSNNRGNQGWHIIPIER
jgi:hypothetical protein